MTIDPAWIEDAIVGARPQAIAALLRHFRDLDLAEEAFQEASSAGAAELAAQRCAA